MALKIINRQRRFALDRKAIRAVVKSLLGEHGAAGADLTLTFATDARLHELNRDYRGIDRPTDVLSFVMQEGEGEPDEGEELVLGDIFISVDRAAVQSRRFRRTVNRELLKLTAHGVLHLLGHEHNTEKRRRDMMRTENRHVRAAVKGSK